MFLSTVGYKIHRISKSVNACQRLSTQQSHRKCLIRCDLSFVNTVNFEICAYNILRCA